MADKSTVRVYTDNAEWLKYGKLFLAPASLLAETFVAAYEVSECDCSHACNCWTKKDQIAYITAKHPACVLFYQPTRDEVRAMAKRFMVKSAINPAMILCTDGDFHFQGVIGPGCQYSAKLYKTRRGAESVRGGHQIDVRQTDERGIEVNE